MKNSFSFLLIIFLVILLTSCATIFTSKTKVLDVNSNVSSLYVSDNQSEKRVCTDKVIVRHKVLNELEFSKEGYHSKYEYVYPEKFRTLSKMGLFLVVPFFVDYTTHNYMKVTQDEININLVPRVKLEDTCRIDFEGISFSSVASNGVGDYVLKSSYHAVPSVIHNSLFSNVNRTVDKIENSLKLECNYSGLTFDEDAMLALSVDFQGMVGMSNVFYSDADYFMKNQLRTNILFTISSAGEPLFRKTISQTSVSYSGIAEDKIGLYSDLLDRIVALSATEFLSDEEVQRFLIDYSSSLSVLFAFTDNGFMSFTAFNDMILDVVVNDTVKTTGLFVNNNGTFIFVKPFDQVESVKAKLPNGLLINAEVLQNIEDNPLGIGRVKTNSKNAAFFTKQEVQNVENLVVLRKQNGKLWFQELNDARIGFDKELVFIESDDVEFLSGDLLCTQEGRVIGFVILDNSSERVVFYNISKFIK